MDIITITQLNASTPRPVVIRYKGLQFVLADSQRWSEYRLLFSLDGGEGYESNSIQDVKEMIRLHHAAGIEEKALANGGLTTRCVPIKLKAIAKNTGRTILSCERQFEGEDCFIVLAEWRGEYVTWTYSNDCAFYYGHYFQSDVDGAIADYHERLGRINH